MDVAYCGPELARVSSEATQSSGPEPRCLCSLKAPWRPSFLQQGAGRPSFHDPVSWEKKKKEGNKKEKKIRPPSEVQGPDAKSRKHRPGLPDRALFPGTWINFSRSSGCEGLGRWKAYLFPAERDGRAAARRLADWRQSNRNTKSRAWRPTTASPSPPPAPWKRRARSHPPPRSPHRQMLT